jgi:hypothetical protein
MPDRLSTPAKRAIDSIAADTLDKTVWLGTERADALDAIALILKTRARELRNSKG